MIEKKKVTQKDCEGAKIILINFLDGAIADFEENMIDNDFLINGCINTLYILGDTAEADDYEKRMNKARAKYDKLG